jgi:UDP-glucuronate 4-epimerase
MRFLVTGGAGFIGAHLCSALATDSSNEVLAVDSLSDYYSVALKEKRIERFLTSQGANFQYLDLSDAQSTQKVISEFSPDVIYHLGAQAGIRLPIDKYQMYIKSNLLGFANVLTSSITQNVSTVLYASSSSVYGDHAKIPLAEDELNLKPTSFYGATKLSNEVMAQSIAKKFPIKIRGLRYFTVYGPWGRPDMSYFRVIESLVNNQTFKLFGDGQIRRDFTYIDDVVRSCVLLGRELDAREAGFHDIVNVGGGNPESISDMVHELERLTGKSLKVEIHPSNASDVKVTHSDSQYLESLIGKHSFTRLSEGLKKILAWAENSVSKDELRSWVASSL